MSKDLGFGKVSKAEPRKLETKMLDLSGFEPRQPERAVSPKEEQIDQLKADQAAERAGFQSREPTQRIKRIRKSSEPLDQAFVRAPLDVINRFKDYCNQTGMSYGEALEELMRKAGI